MDDESEYKNMLPAILTVEKGQSYLWCGCGESKKQPFCDKEHCGDKSVCYFAKLTEEVSFCNCKQTKNPPWCDGSHSAVLLEFIKKRQKNA